MSLFAARTSEGKVTLSALGQYLKRTEAHSVIGSIVGRARRKRLIEDVASATQPGKTLDGISWREFEMLVGEAFRRKGFVVSERGGSGADGGVDLDLHLGKDKYLVQCKQWKANKVGVTVMREFFGVMVAEGAAKRIDCSSRAGGRAIVWFSTPPAW